MQIKSKTFIGQEPVYDISVDSPHHDFQLENGVVVSNCFNKAHSVSYSVLTYVTAYLKANYPVEFFTALMSTRSKTLQPKTWAVKAPEYINEAKHFGVDIFPPDINRSSFEFTIHDNEIYFGLNAIRDVGGTAAKYIINARGNTPFKDIWDFINRVNTQKVNTKVFQGLVKAGAFDKLGYVRSELLENVDSIYSYLKEVEEVNQRKLDIIERNKENERLLPLIEQRNFLRAEIIKLKKKVIKNPNDLETQRKLNQYETELQPLEEMELKKLVDLKEKELPVKPELNRTKEVPITITNILDQASYIGCYIGGHPLHLTNINREDLDTLEEGFRYRVAGVVVSNRVITTKKGKKMAVLEIDDSTKAAEIVIFPQIYETFASLNINEGDIIIADVKCEETEPDLKLIGNKFLKHIWDIEDDSNQKDLLLDFGGRANPF
jgi:DNA polymerase-3 subunit alpha